MTTPTQPTSTAESRAVPAARHDLGVLFVHGIGDKQQGETLNEFGSPILKWIARWLEPDARLQRMGTEQARRVATKDVEGEVRYTQSALRPPDLPMEMPAHAEATIHARVRGVPAVEQRWLFAESWWSPQTLTPNVSTFLLWLITRGPWILLLHLSQVFCIDYAEMLRQLGEPTSDDRKFLPRLRLLGTGLRVVAATLLWLAISLLLVTSWGVVSLIALVPVGYVRAQVYAVLQAITGVVGDSFVMVNDPFQRAAFVSTTRKALEWLAAQGCRKVVVIAHSQGAAVARDVLLQSDAPQVHGFVTLGPGIAKLDALIDRERMAPEEFMWCGVAAPLTALTLGSFAHLLSSGREGFALWGFPGVAALLAWLAIASSWRSISRTLARLKPSAAEAARIAACQPSMRWQDFYASSDPVSNGSLSATVTSGLRRIVSRKVMVRGSVLQDHTAYWNSRGDFVGRVAQVLDRCAGAGLFTPSGTARVRAGRAMYIRCVHHLMSLRWMSVAALLLPLLQASRLAACGAELMRWLWSLKIASLEHALDGLESAVDWVARQFATEYDSRAGAGTLLLVLGVVLALHVWGRIVAYWWEFLANLSLSPVYRPSSKRWAAINQVFLFVMVSALGALPLALSAAWTFDPELISLGHLDDFLAMFAKVTFALIYAFMVWVAVLVTFEFVGRLREQALQGKGLRASLAAVDEFWFPPGLWLFMVLAGWMMWRLFQ